MRRFWKWTQGILYLAVLLGLLVLCARFWHDLTRIWSDHLGTFLAVTGLMGVGVVVQAWNFRSFLPRPGGIGLLPNTRIWALASLMNYLGPFQAGLIVRVALLKQQGITVHDATLATLRQLVGSVWLAVGFLGISLLSLGDRWRSIGPVLIAACVALPLLQRWLRARLSRPPASTAPVRQTLAALVMPLRPASFLGLLAQYALGTLVFLIGFRQFGFDISATQALGLAALIYVSAIVALLPGNLGVLEAICTTVGQGAGLGLEQSLALALLYRGANVAGLLVMLVSASLIDRNAWPIGRNNSPS